MTPAQKLEREKLAEEYTKKIWRGGSRPYASAERYSWLDFIAGYESALKQPKVISFSVGVQGAGGAPYDRTECLSTKEKSQVDESKWKDPTPEMLNDPIFERIWECIKTWDINVPSAYIGYMGATGNHVRAILDSLKLTAEGETPIHPDWYANPEKAKEAIEWERALRKAIEDVHLECPKRIQELEKTQASTDESELVHAVKSLDNSRIQELEHRLSLPKVPQSEETRALTKRILELEAECARLRDAITRVRNAIALGTWNLDERHKNFALEVNKLFESTLEVTNG